VDDALSAYDAEQLRRDRLQEVVRQDQSALAVAQQRYREGAIDFLNVLTVQRDLLNAESDLAQSRAIASINFVSLYKALGGGWETAFPEGPPAVERAESVPLNTAHTAAIGSGS
jgi:outer membrane protein TolC